MEIIKLRSEKYKKKYDSQRDNTDFTTYFCWRIYLNKSHTHTNKILVIIGVTTSETELRFLVLMRNIMSAKINCFDRVV